MLIKTLKTIKIKPCHFKLRELINSVSVDKDSCSHVQWLVSLEWNGKMLSITLVYRTKLEYKTKLEYRTKLVYRTKLKYKTKLEYRTKQFTKAI